MAMASIASCDSEPLPIDAKLYFPGFFFSSATSSSTELTPRSVLTASTLGWVTSWVMGAMSLRGSYGRFANSRVLMASGPPMLTPRVEPSGVAFATTSVPILPLAPGLFSMTNALAGYFCCSPSETRRATISGVDPGRRGPRSGRFSEARSALMSALVQVWLLPAAANGPQWRI